MRLAKCGFALLAVVAGCNHAATQAALFDPPATPSTEPAEPATPAEPVSGDVRIDGVPCSTTPTLFARGMTALAHDDRWLYGFDSGRVVRVGIAGGAPETVVDALLSTNAWGLLVDDEALYWTTYDAAGGTSVFWRAPKRGGAAAEVTRGLHSSAPFAQRLVMFGDELFYATDGPAVAAVSTRGGSPRIVAQPVRAGADVVAVDDANVYWLAGESSGRPDVHNLETAPRLGGAARVLAQWMDVNHSQPHIFADDTFLYDVDYAIVRRIDKRDGTVRVLWGGDGAPPIASGWCRGATLAGGHLYWASFYEDWIFTVAGVPLEYVSRVGVDGSDPTALLSFGRSPAPDGMVAWLDSLYLNVRGDVWRMCK